MTDTQADIAVIGLAVMGQNLVLNLADHGFTVAVHNRTVSKIDEFLAGPGRGKSIVGAPALPELVRVLKRPRRILMMVKAGEAVDATIEQLLPLLEPGDILIDGGNSHYADTQRRCRSAEAKGLLFVGCGVSGGEEGARHGPALMPGGSAAAWPALQPILQAIAARASDGTPCCDWIGPDGAGHFVKMVHNGIEYGDMQLIAEAYHVLRAGIGLSVDELHRVFAAWNEGELDSFLIAITRDILAYRERGRPLLDKILDAAGQKGTGKWTTVASLDLGVPLTLIAEATFARALSALKEQRVAASRLLPKPPVRRWKGARSRAIEQVRLALYASKIVSYAQGFMLLAAASTAFGWRLDLGRIASIWRNGCIIRSRFLDDITRAYARQPDLPCLLLAPFFKRALAKAQEAWRTVVSEAALCGLPTPAFSSALAFYDGYRSKQLPANLIQAQRDYFGAHTYERLDRPRGEFFHTDWTGRGGTVTAQSYNA
ncbi:MAG: decarboxylating NADP(+)-dependent phosphogluconate dehydrogenase [Planctomycetota bacterium]|nr:decarboxylating NADP(+)-dependent phosphogluconate dehydrogenase [Planctomycetota bacterium]MCX8039100.1 decarboxylating NADP(+)-dependent phosphogluconate dehydrogenase [Planctomycetota bacterium]